MAEYQTLPQHDRHAEEEDGTFFQPPPQHPLKSFYTHHKKSAVLLASVAIAVLASSAFFLGASNELSHNKVHWEPTGISAARFAEGVAKCNYINRENKHEFVRAENRTSNPRFVKGTKATFFTNGSYLDGETGKIVKGSLLIDQGLIVAMGTDLKAPKSAVVVDLKGHILTPGIVDMHSHLGVDSWPSLAATQDTNEMTQPLTPFVRSIDGFNPSDMAREWVVSGGVTSILVLPGSGNMMGGEAYAFKMRKVDTLSTDDMLIQAGEDDKWRYMKMACGENPKSYYGSLNRMPSTRLGEGWLFRDQFDKARSLKNAQDDWCAAAEALPKYGRHRLSSPFPEDLQYESLVGLLRDDVKLNVHCYETHDLESMVRNSNEYKFEIAAFHHALDAYRVPEILKRAYKTVPTIATFANMFGYKKEAFQASVKSPSILAKAGIPVAFKSDHAILNSQYLMYEAAMGHHFGLSEELSLASVTSVPAKAMGLDHRIGKLAVGMDADVVVWTKHPLALGAHPLQVYIDGVEQIANVDPTEWEKLTDLTAPRTDLEDLAVPKDDQDACTTRSESGIFVGIKKIILEDAEMFSEEGKLVVVMKDGKIVCSGYCQQFVDELNQSKNQRETTVYDLGGEGYVLPSAITFGPPGTGMWEISSEESTGDGIQNLAMEGSILYAVDGLKFGGLHLDEAFKAGVLTAVTSPVSEHVVQGVSVAFSTGATDALSSDDAILKERTALHVRIGQDSKSDSFSTISSQIGFLRAALRKGAEDIFTPNSEFTLVARGKLPLVIDVDNRDEIVSIIRMKRELQEEYGSQIKIVLFSATEAWTVADYLAGADIGVILRPYHCMPSRWTAQHCLPGAPLSEETGLSVLLKAGVKVGLAVQEMEDVRQLPWMAAWARSDSNLTDRQAVGLVSWNLAQMLQLPKNSNNGLVFYKNDPFEFGSNVAVITGGGKSGVTCNPKAQ